MQESRRILSMLENVPEDAMPPESLWHSPQKCKAWIDEHMSLDKKKSGGFLEFKDTEIETKQ